jgi:REase_AHJR-like
MDQTDPGWKMDFEQELKRVAGSYTAQGYQVVVEPRPDDLPSFARDFKVELVGKRAAEGVLVAVKKNRDALAADANLPRYAEITSAQPGWRFDFAILESEEPGARELRGAQELPDEDVIKALGDAEQLAPTGFLRPALTTAWAGFEAAMRRRLRASGETAGWGTSPRPMLNELYSSGILSAGEFRRLEQVYRLRNEIAHGFASPTLDAGVVQFLVETARRLLTESQPAKKTA